MPILPPKVRVIGIRSANIKFYEMRSTMTDKLVEEDTYLLQYSSHPSASSSVPVPMFKQIKGSVPSSRHHWMNSSIHGIRNESIREKNARLFRIDYSLQ